MIVIQRRYNGTEFEQMATYEDGDLEGDEDFVEAFGYMFPEDGVDESTILERFSGPNLVASIPEGDEGNPSVDEGNEVEASANAPETVELDKYRVYLGEAEDLSEAEEMAPDWANVQEGTQGGFSYDTEDKPGEGGDEEEYGNDDGLTSHSLSDGGFEVEEFDGENIGVDLADAQVGEGDLLYVEHPDEPPYIAEVDDVETGWSDWKVDFGGGSYTLRESTNSQPLGVVEETPELGEQERTESISTLSDVDEGDTVYYQDPAGYDHYVEAEKVHPSPPADIAEIETEVGRIEESEIDGKVVVEDPTQKYDLPDEQQIEETTNISDPEKAVTFTENVAKAVANGDATDVNCRKYQYYVGALQDEDQAIDAYQSIVNNDGSATHRDMIERQLRSLGIDPQSVHPESFDYDPDEVPPKRQNTKYENFDGEQATQAVAHVIQENNIGDNNWAEWNDFFDSMTDDELEEAAKKALSTKINRNEYGGDPMDYETSDMSTSVGTPDMYSSSRDNVSSCLSRIGRGDPDRQREAYQSIKAAVPDNREGEVNELAAKWMQDPDVREEVFEQSTLVADEHADPGIAMQFADDHDTRASAFLGQYVGSTNSTATQHARAALLQYGPNQGAQVSKFNKGLATESVQPAEKMVETLDQLREESSQLIEEEYGGEVELKRGISDPITSNAAAESWTTSHSTANTFDGHAIMKATFEPGDVIATNEVQEHYDYGYYQHSHESEWTCLGGPIAEAVPDKYDPDEYLDIDTGVNPGMTTDG